MGGLQLLALISFLTTLTLNARAFPAGDGKVNDKFPYYTHKEISYNTICNGDTPIFDEYSCRCIYYGNLLRDLSQVHDVSLREKFGRSTLTSAVGFLVKNHYGYKEDEFSVTDERLLVYRPEEHLDNPSYLQVQEARQDVDSRFRGPLTEGELDISSVTSEKNYLIPNSDFAAQPAYMTALKYFQQVLNKSTSTLYAATQAPHDSKDRKGQKLEALMHFGSLLHALEDYYSHSNYVELALHELGGYDYDAIFPFVGRDTTVMCGGKPCFPLVTGRHSLEGIETKITFLGLAKGKFQSWETQFSPLRFIRQFISQSLSKAETKSGEGKLFEDPKETNPTHAQINKDSNDNPLHVVAAQCAMHAVKMVSLPISQLFQQIEAGGISPAEIENQVSSIVNLIARILSHPSMPNKGPESEKILGVVKSWAEDPKHSAMITSGKVGYASCKQGRNRLF
ncbi:heterokaryon incompatibility protein Het-C-domain-containing protein [Paraphysoderma sedebokerense]|nr:heterokaryon incompatibility protein Het-C-domain-containing protein [Paraphysoderma sedebokerense]